jgi:hypothetical protein
MEHFMTFSILNSPSGGFKDLSVDLIREDGKLKLLPADHYKQYRWEDFRYFCHEYARYGIPTIELVDYIKQIIDDRCAIEIGAGAGDLGFHLGIHMTDSKKQQDDLIIRAYYKAMNQPTIKYPKDVEKIDSLEAVKKYKPKVVVASWITPYSKHETTFGSNPNGVKEDKILELVDTFIIIGNIGIHGDKPILSFTHKSVNAPWIVSRAKNDGKNVIFIWEKNNA